MWFSFSPQGAVSSHWIQMVKLLEFLNSIQELQKISIFKTTRGGKNQHDIEGGVLTNHHIWVVFALGEGGAPQESTRQASFKHPGRLNWRFNKGLAILKWICSRSHLCVSVPHYLEVKDDGPYQPQGQLGVSIRDIVIPDVDQFDLKGARILSGQFICTVNSFLNWSETKNSSLKVSLFSDLSVFEKVQGDLYILQLVEAHPAFLPRLQERRGRRTSGGANASGLDDQQTARAPMTEERVFQVSSNTLCVHKQPSILL